MSDGRRGPSRRRILGTAGLALAGAITGTTMTSGAQETDTGTDTPDGNGSGQGEGRQRVLKIISDWTEKQRTETKRTMDKYGVPDGITERQLIWYDAGPWQQIDIFADTTKHNFPKPHPDFYQTTIDYQVPSDKADELMTFDGSVYFKRTEGTLSARCHTEWTNFLSINLAHDIITGEKSVKEARRAYGKKVIQYANGETPPYTESLQFEPPEGRQVDHGVSIIQNGEVNLQDDYPC